MRTERVGLYARTSTARSADSPNEQLSRRLDSPHMNERKQAR